VFLTFYDRSNELTYYSQPHSTVNLYRKQVDDRALVIIPILSWIEHMAPQLVIIENVKGFLDYKLHFPAGQGESGGVQGDIKMGGLKFLVHALVSLGCLSLSTKGLGTC
jgi:DNA (cytosine-5)-methyltransferase 1